MNTLESPTPRYGVFGKLIVVAVLLVVAGLLGWAEYNRRLTTEELSRAQQELAELKETTQSSRQEISEEVLQKVRTHFYISENQQPTVATITDVERLKQVSDFYSRAQNNDYLIIISDPPRAILYNPDENVILDIVPVTLEQADQAQQGAQEP